MSQTYTILHNELKKEYDFYISEKHLPIQKKSEQEFFLNQKNETYAYSLILIKKLEFPKKEVYVYTPQWNEKFKKRQKYTLVKNENLELKYLEDYPIQMFESNNLNRNSLLFKKWLKDIQKKYPDILYNENKKKFSYYIKEYGIFFIIFALSNTKEERIKNLFKFEDEISLQRSSLNKLYNFFKEQTQTDQECNDLFLKFLIEKNKKNEITSDIEKKLIQFLKMIFLNDQNTFKTFLKKLDKDYQEDKNLTNLLKINSYKYKEVIEIDFDLIIRKLPFKEEQIKNLFDSILFNFSNKEKIIAKVLFHDNQKITYAFFSEEKPIDIEKIKNIYLEVLQKIQKENDFKMQKEIFEAIYLNHTLEKKEKITKMKI